MTAIDIWASAAAAIAGLALAFRGELLKPNLRRFVAAPPLVFLSLILTSIVLVARVITLKFGGLHATAWEAAVYTALAVTSVVLLVNILRQALPASDPAEAAAPAALPGRLRASR